MNKPTKAEVDAALLTLEEPAVHQEVMARLHRRIQELQESNQKLLELYGEALKRLRERDKERIRRFSLFRRLQ